jgi:hypothetical protein
MYPSQVPPGPSVINSIVILALLINSSATLGPNPNRMDSNRDICAQHIKRVLVHPQSMNPPLDMPLTVVVPDTSRVVITASKGERLVFLSYQS